MEARHNLKVRLVKRSRRIRDVVWKSIQKGNEMLSSFAGKITSGRPPENKGEYKCTNCKREVTVPTKDGKCPFCLKNTLRKVTK